MLISAEAYRTRALISLAQQKDVVQIIQNSTVPQP
jgi:hypothetical protein